MPSDRPAVSIVVPVYNEEAALPQLFAAMEHAGPSYPTPVEYVFVNDGSRDRSGKIVDLAVNSGQHAALMAGLEHSEGDVIVTMDADLQNLPVDIPKLVEKVNEGYDVVAGWRKDRHDPLTRRTASWMMNRVVGQATGHYLHDYGCMLRAYSRTVIDAMVACPERRVYLPVLANSFAKRVTEENPSQYRSRVGGIDRSLLGR